MALAGLSTGTAQAATWTVTQIPDTVPVEGIFWGVSCPSESMCVVVGTNSGVATSTNPTGGASAWNVTNLEPPYMPPVGAGGNSMFPGNALRSVACPTTDLCVVAGWQGRIFTSTNPTGGAPAWSRTELGQAASHVYGVSCPSRSLCIAVDYKGRLVTSTDPTGGPAAWKIEQLGPYALRGVSCPTATLCAAVGNEGNILVSTDPRGGPAAWKLVGAPGGGESINGISCPSTSLCVTGDSDQIITSTDPGNPASWSAALAGTGLPIKGVSCLSSLICTAVDNNADLLTSANPTGGAAAWSFVNVLPAPFTKEGEPNGMFAISCASATMCVAAGTRRKILTSTDPHVPTPTEPPVNRKRPQVRITRHPAKRTSPRKGGTKVTFRFRAIGAVVRFKCKLDGRHGYRTCKSPRRYRLGSGKYMFRVIAIGLDGLKSRPATFHFSIGGLSEAPPVDFCAPGKKAPPGSRPCQGGSS